MGGRGAKSQPKSRGGGNMLLPALVPSTPAQPKSGGNPLAVKGTPATSEEALERVNKDNFHKDRAYRVNCQRCVWAFEAQKRGYDVEALPNTDNLGADRKWLSIVGGKDNFKGQYIGNLLGKNTRASEAKYVKDQMAQWGEGSRGIITIARRSGSGHVFNVEYKRGKVIVWEAQTGEKHGSLATYMKDQKAMLGFSQLYRTDNATFVESEAPKYFKTREK